MNDAGITEPNTVKNAKYHAEPSTMHTKTIKGRPRQSTDPTEPLSLTRIRTAAVAAGWACTTIYALGTTSTNKPHHVYLLRMYRRQQRVSAVWQTTLTEEPLKWKFTYAAICGTWIVKKLDTTTPEIDTIPFGLSAAELKSVITTPYESITLISDKQYEALEAEGKHRLFTSETQFRTQHNKATTRKRAQ